MRLFLLRIACVVVLVLTDSTIVRCQTCGEPYAVDGPNPGRIRRCHKCPPLDPSATPAPDMQTQREELLGAVRDGNRNWEFDDRIDIATKTRRKP